MEALTGAGLVLAPNLVAGLIFGANLHDLGPVFAKICGIALLSLGIACLPKSLTASRPSIITGMLALNALLVLYLIIYAIRGEPVGWLFWPAVFVHAVLSVVLALEWLRYGPLRARPSSSATTP